MSRERPGRAPRRHHPVAVLEVDDAVDRERLQVAWGVGDLAGRLAHVDVDLAQTGGHRPRGGRQRCDVQRYRDWNSHQKMWQDMER